jgi:cytoskeletal protein CcmA (bactofilin family)
MTADKFSLDASNFIIVETNKNMDTNMSVNSTGKNLLNSDVEVKGNLKFAGELTFEGKLDGEIHTDGILMLGDSAVINGNIVAQSVVVRGKITGNISAKDKIEIKAKAEVFGDVRATKLAIEEGVIFVGKTEVNPNKVSPTPPPARPAELPKPPEPSAKSVGR